MDALEPERNDHWYGYFDNHSLDEIMKLIQDGSFKTLQIDEIVLLLGLKFGNLTVFLVFH